MSDVATYIYYNGERFQLMYHLAGTWETPLDIALAPTEQDAREGRYKVTGKRNVLFYTEGIWLDCVEFNGRKEKRLQLITDERRLLLKRFNMQDNSQPQLQLPVLTIFSDITFDTERTSASE